MTTERDHIWRSSTLELGFVGSLYPHLYPLACRCGAMKNWKGTVSEPKELTNRRCTDVKCDAERKEDAKP